MKLYVKNAKKYRKWKIIYKKTFFFSFSASWLYLNEHVLFQVQVQFPVGQPMKAKNMTLWCWHSSEMCSSQAIAQ